MLEADKVSHILKGIADDAFNLLVYKGCSTVDDIIRECRRFEEAKSRRVSQQFVRLPNTAASSSCEDVQPPGTENLLRLVRREIEAASPSVPPIRSYDESRPAVSLIQAVVREELANAGIRPTCSVSSPTVGNFFRPPRPQSTYLRYRDPNLWRTHDDKPICFNCNGVGHISRHCRYRQISSPRPAYAYRPEDSRFSPFHARNDLPHCDVAAPTPHYDRRSPSPQNRRSRSPIARRSPSPYPRRPSSEN